MKKIILCLMVLGLSLGAFAQNNEIGLVVGGLNGLSYKKMMSEDFAIQTDLAVGFQRTSMDWLGDSELITAPADLFDFVINPNFLYNKELKYGIYAFAGGGASVGLAQGLLHVGHYDPITFGKFGLNAMIGAGYKLADLPLTFALDFRPGYAMLLNVKTETLLSIFDWHLAASVRYCF